MKRFTILFSFVFLVLFAGNQMVNAQFWSLDFESAGGYTTSIPEFTDGNADFWIRTDGSDHGSYVVYNGVQGSYYFAGMDIDGEGASLPVFINIDDINISGQTNLEFRIYLAEDQSSDGNEDWDGSDYFHVGYDIDNSGSFTPLLWVEGAGSSNTEPRIDTDFNGIGDGTEITDTFVQFSVSIPGTGTYLDIELEFNLNSGDEDIAIDHLEIFAAGGNSPPAITNVTQTPSSDITSTTTVSVSADVTDSDGTVSLVELHWGTASGVLTNTINMSNTGGDTYTTDSDIPAQAVGTTVYYKVYAEDDLGDNSNSPEYNYTVIEPQSTIIPYTESFDADLGQCYTKSVSGATKFWEYGSYGGNGFADMNGYGSDETEEDWLILPGINFDNYANEIMTFDTWWQYGSDDVNNYLKLYYSADYPGIGDPTTYTWTELTFTQGSSGAWTSSGYLDLSGILGTSVYIAFKYHYEVGNYRHWEVDNISIFESVPVNVTFQVNMVEEIVSGDGVHVAGSFNGWDPAATVMLDGDGDDVYTVTLSLYSNIEYQFKYINGNAWGYEENVPPECQAPGTTNRFEVVSSPDYSIDVVCFSSCVDCGTLFDYDITFQVDMQNEIVSGDGVYLAGSFTNWGINAILMTANGSVWSTTVALQETSYQEYKFVNGDPNSGGQWESFSGSCLVGGNGNRYFTVPSANTTLDLVCFNSCDACPVADFVIINEVDADQTSTDNAEFIELYDGGVGNTDLTGLVVVLFNGSGDISYRTFDLDGYSTGLTGYFVIGSSLVPNVDYVFTSSTNQIQNGADAVALYVGDDTDFPNGTPVTDVNLLDALVYDTDDGDDTGLISVLLNTGQPQINERGRGDGELHSNQRIPNGSGGQRNTDTYDQSPPTSGTENILMFTDWTGAFDNVWDNTANWHNGVPDATLGATIPDVSKAPFPVITGSATCNSLFIYAGASLEIATTGALTVNGTFTNNGTLTVKSDATGTGSLIESSGVNATVERYYTGGEWHIIGSPVAGAVSGMFTGLYLQNHTESTNLWTDISVTSVPLAPLQGFALYSSSAGTASFAGTLNTGTIGATDNLTRSATGTGNGWNAVSNPFASSINWDAAAGWTKTKVNDATWRHVNATTWATYAAGVGTPAGTTGNFAPGQGFFVEVTDDGSTVGTLQVGLGARVHSSDPFYKNSIQEMLRLEASGNGYSDEAVIRFLDDATQGYDSKYDAHKLFVTHDEVPQIYSMANDYMTINALPETDFVVLGFKVNVSGEYTISATEINDISSVWLEDTFTGVFTNLTVDSYSFTYTVDENEDRFIVHFTPLAVDENTEDIFNIYSYGNEVYVSVPENTKGNIVIYNIIGQEVVNAPINNVLNKITLEKSAYYIVKVLSDESMVTRKVFIK